MNTKSYAGVRLKTVNIYTVDNIGTTFRAIRETLGKKIVEMESNGYLVEANTKDKDFKINTIIKYAKELGAKNIRIHTGTGTGTRINCPIETVGRKLRAIRKGKGLCACDISGTSQTSVFNMEGIGKNCFLGNYINYMTQLGIDEAKIFV